MRSALYFHDVMIYCDNAATTFCSKNVAQKLSEFYSTPHGNPSALHELGRQSSSILKESREYFANHFRVKTEQVVFTASGTEANNLGLSGILSKKKPGKILTTQIEHSSVLRTLEKWGDRGFSLECLRVDQFGQLDLDDLKRKLQDPSVCLVSLMTVNNEIGTVEKIAEIGKLIGQKKAQIHFHVDGVQAFGKVSLEFQGWNVDTLSLSSHKIHGPVGAGALIKKDGLVLEPLLFGGGQEHGLRSGTESIGMIYGFYLAAKEILENQRESFEKVQKLKHQFIEGLEMLPYKIKINGHRSVQNRHLEEYLPNSPFILNVSFSGVNSEIMLRFLEQEAIYASAGSSCNMKYRRPSHVLKAIGCLEDELFSAIRFSFSPYTDEAEIASVLQSISKILSHLERMKLISKMR